MHFEEEVCELVVSHNSIHILIIPEDIGDHVEDVELVGFHEGAQDSNDLLFFEIKVVVGVVLLDKFEHAITHTTGQIQTRKVKVRSYVFFGLDE